MNHKKELLRGLWVGCWCGMFALGCEVRALGVQAKGSDSEVAQFLGSKLIGVTCPIAAMRMFTLVAVIVARIMSLHSSWVWFH